MEFMVSTDQEHPLRESTSSLQETSEKISIAVLPFVDRSPNKDQDWYCAGIAETIINMLTQFNKLRVLNPNSSFIFKGENRNIKEIGDSLNVEMILVGSIQKTGKQLRIIAQLINVAD